MIKNIALPETESPKASPMRKGVLVISLIFMMMMIFLILLLIFYKKRNC